MDEIEMEMNMRNINKDIDKITINWK